MHTDSRSWSAPESDTAACTEGNPITHRHPMATEQGNRADYRSLTLLETPTMYQCNDASVLGVSTNAKSKGEKQRGEAKKHKTM